MSLTPPGRRLAALLTATLLLGVLPAAPAHSLAPDPAPLPTPARLKAVVNAVSTKGLGKVGYHVTTPEGAVLASKSATRAFTPASTMKVLTSMTALDALGAERRFVTRVTDGGSGRIVLVGGGDPLLTNKTSTSSYKTASLQKLAKATAKALKASGRTAVKLRYDATLFSGPLFSNHWRTSWKRTESRVSSLEMNSGRLSSGRPATNPAATAASAFATRLRAAGITVTSITKGKAVAGRAEVARVTSTTLARIVKRTLRESDNVAAETLLRHAALASGRPGSFSGGAATIRSWLASHGLSATVAVIRDGSGLAPSAKLTPSQLTGAIRLALAEPRYAPVISGLPVAGVSGTLKKRFNDPSEKAGRKNVHAKTGTLRDVAGLAGFLTTADGQVLVFASLANQASSISRAYNWLDRTAAAMARCGCR